MVSISDIADFALHELTGEPVNFTAPLKLNGDIKTPGNVDKIDEVETRPRSQSPIEFVDQVSCLGHGDVLKLS
jgi:hypothetical protein